MKSKAFGVLLVLLIFFFGVITAAIVFKGKSLPLIDKLESKSAAAISGVFDVNGTIPDGATISITARTMDEVKGKVVASGLPVGDQAPWSFNNAVSGETYEVQAQVIVNGEKVAVSDPLDVTAPADDEVLTLNLESKSFKRAVISGNIQVNGYIPPNSTIVIKGKTLSAKNYTTVASGLAAKPSQFMSYGTAIEGTTYNVQGLLLSSSGAIIGTSDPFTVTAPAVNEKLVINSSATAPKAQTTNTQNNSNNSQPTSVPVNQGASSISGSINFNGAAPANSRIVILQKPLNSANYQVAVNNVTPQDGQTWQWTGAQNASWYTVVAVLKQAQPNGTDQDIATSAPITIATPATNVILTVNSGMSLSAPGGPISVNCQTYNGGPNQNTWTAIVTFQTIPGAQSYWYQVGSANGGNNIVNTTGNSNGASQQQIEATLNNNTTYYARYAYANVPNLSTGNSQYSGFSNTQQIQCSN